jgi:nucleoside-diphosphate-sugar epimerase
MRVFLAGATGAIGRRLIPKLLAAGHEVTGTTRYEQRAVMVRETGADIVVCDALDAEGVRAAVVAARPDVLVHELTALPDRLDFRKEETYAATNRLRTEGTDNLLAAARDAGARRFVCQSIAFAYEHEGARVKTEDDPLLSQGPGAFANGMKAIAQMEGAVTGADWLEGLVLRYGFFYGPGTYYAPDGSTAEDVRRRRMPVVAKGTGLFSFIHVDDAAAATVAAVERGTPGIYNVVDDEPAQMREWLPVYAEAIGARKPMRVPGWLARFVAGPEAAALATSLPGASNAKAKRELGWEPRWASWREGFREAPR